MATVLVTVLDQQDLPVPVATVVLKGPKGQYSGVTNVSGYVELSVPSNSYFVIAKTHSSYVSHSGKLFLEAGGTAKLKFRLLFIDSTGFPEIALKFENVEVPGSVAVPVIRFVKKEVTEKDIRYTGQGLEVGIGRLILRGTAVTCHRDRIECRMEGQTVFDLDDRTVSAREVSFEAQGIRQGRVVANFKGGTKEMSFEELMMVPDR